MATAGSHVANKVRLRKADLGDPTTINPATEETLAAILAAVDGLEVSVGDVDLNTDQLEAKIDAVTAAIVAFNTAFGSRDLATQTTLAGVKLGTDKIPADPAREGGNLATLAGKDFATQTTLALVKAKTDNLDVALSTRATEATLVTRASETTLATLKARADLLATETTLALVKAKTDNLDIALSALRDALRGASSRDLTTLQMAIEATTTAVTAFNSAFTARDLATETTLAAIRVSMEIMDDWDESDRAKVNPIVGQAGVSAGAGGVDAKTQRVTLTTEQQNILSSISGPDHSRDYGNEQTTPLTNAAPVTFTADSITDLIHKVGHGLVLDQPIWLTTAGTLPAGLSASTLYYVAAPVTADDFKLSTTRSDAFGHATINFTDNGTGTHSYIIPGEFTGTYHRVSDIDHFEIIYLSLTSLGIVEKIWSNDGLVEMPLNPSEPILTSRSAIVNNPLQGFNIYYDVNEGRNIAPFYKLHIINGPTSQAATPTWASITWLQKTPYAGNFGLLTATLNNLSRALLTRSVVAGFDPNLTFTNLAIQGRHTANSSSTPLTNAAPVTFTANAGTDLLHAVGHGLGAGRAVQITTTGQLPVPLALATTYYISSGGLTADDFKLSLTAKGAIRGEFIDLTSVGSGTHSFVALGTFRGDWFQGQQSYVGVVAEMKASHGGIFNIDLSANDVPTNGVDTDIDDHLTSTYDPNFQSLLRRVEPIQSQWVRIRYVNGPTNQTQFNLDTAFTTTAPPVSQVRLDTPLTDADLAATTRAIAAGRQPDGDYVNAKADGLMYASGLELNAGEISQSIFFDTDGWRSLQLFVETDVAGEVELQFTDDVENTRTVTDASTTVGSPTLTSATALFTSPDDIERVIIGAGIPLDTKILAVVSPTQVTLTKNAIATASGVTVEIGPVVLHIRTYFYTQREIDAEFLSVLIPTELDGFRVIYRNNALAAQADFYLSVNAHVTAVEAPRASLASVQQPVDDAVITKGAIIAPDDTEAFTTIGRDGDGSSLNAHVTAIEDSIAIEALPLGPQTRQFVLTLTAQRIDTPDITSGLKYRFVEVRNAGAFHAFVKEDSTITETNSQPIFLGGNALYGLAPGKQLWGISENTGGSSQIVEKNGTVTGGTGTSTGNTLTSNDVRASIATASLTAYVEGFSFAFDPTFTAISKLRIGYEARKQPSQFETVTQVEVRTGTTTGAGTVTSTSLTGGTGALLVAYVARGTSTATVTSMVGGALTWIQLVANLTVGTKRLDVWYAYGDSTSGTVTANLSASDRADIVVVRYANADPSTPIQASNSTSGSGTAVVGPGLAGTNKGYSVLGVMHGESSATPGAGYTELADIDNGTLDLVVENKALTATTTETATLTLNTSGPWAAIGLTIPPKPANAPTGTGSYLYNAIPGATSSLFTFSAESDATQYLDVTADFVSIAVGDIALIRAIMTGGTLGTAALEIDRIFLEITETSGATTRVAVTQMGAT